MLPQKMIEYGAILNQIWVQVQLEAILIENYTVCNISK